MGARIVGWGAGGKVQPPEAAAPSAVGPCSGPGWPRSATIDPAGQVLRDGAGAAEPLGFGEWLPRRGWLRALLGPAVASAVAAVTWRTGAAWLLPAMVVWSAGLVVLAGADLDRMVLPTRLVYATMAPTAAGLVVTAGMTGAWSRLGWAAASGAAAEAAFGLWAVAIPGALGFGDVRLVGVAGLGLGWFGPSLAVFGLLAGLLTAALVGLLLVAAGRLSWTGRLPVGAFLALGSVATVVVVGAR